MTTGTGNGMVEIAPGDAITIRVKAYLYLCINVCLCHGADGVDHG